MFIASVHIDISQHIPLELSRASLRKISFSIVSKSICFWYGLPLYNVWHSRLRSTAPKAVGIVNILLYYLQPVTDIYLKQVTVKQHMKDIYYLEAKKLLL